MKRKNAKKQDKSKEKLRTNRSKPSVLRSSPRTARSNAPSSVMKPESTPSRTTNEKSEIHDAHESKEMTKSPLQTKEKFPPIGKSQKLSSNANPTQSFNQAVAHERESGKPRSSAEESVDEGCRVCGMDDNYSRLLLCEGCNGEYHTYCLTPPLEKVPVEDWYCDRCTALVEILNKKSRGEPIGSIPLIISQGSEGNSKADPSLPSNHSTKKKSLVESSPCDTADEELPMKEIDTRNGSTAPEYLDENTLRLVRLYVAKCRPQDMLNEDDVILLMHRMDRLTAYQAEFQLNIPGPANERQEVLLEEIKDEEEDHVLGREFFHKLVAKIQKENVESLEKRTLAWLKRATGIHRSSTESFVRDNTSKTGSSRTKGSGRRCTRGMVRQFRKKKSEKGLEILKGALDELEPTLGPFHSAFRKRRRSISTYDDDERSSGKQRKKQEQVQRKNQKGMKAKMNKEMKNGLKRTKPNNENKRKASPSYPNLLHALDWKRRKQLHSKRNKPGSSILLDINHAQRSLKLPKKLRNKGIVMTLPRWGSIKQAESFAPKESVFGPPRGLYSDQHYSFWSLRLMNFLQSSARTWVSHEFFYSDLDKAWYNSSALSKMARRFGVDPTISLDSAEWKCVRRALHGIKAKPRRFSRCFISEQLHERDEFRSGVRLLQQNLGASHAAYDLKSCIPVGSVVTAYSQTFGMLQRGTVLTFEARNAHYLVRFENMDFGYEYCPDSEVASHGSVLPLHVSGGAESKTTTSNAILRKYCAPAWSRSMKLATELEGCTEFTPFRSQSQKKGRRSISETDSHWAFIKEAAEEETLQCLLDVINTAAIRKSALLKAIDTLITPANSELEKAKSAIQTQEREGNLALLVLNLEKTNKTIRNSVRKIRLLYAQVYPLRITQVTSHHDTISRAIYHSSECRYGPISDALIYPWVTSLLENTGTIGKFIAASLLPQRRDEDLQQTDRRLFSKERLSCVGQLLLAASYRPLKDQALENQILCLNGVLASRYCKLRGHAEQPRSELEELYSRVSADREVAQSDLLKALESLQSEFFAAKFAAPVQSHQQQGDIC